MIITGVLFLTPKKISSGRKGRADTKRPIITEETV